LYYICEFYFVSISQSRELLLVWYFVEITSCSCYIVEGFMYLPPVSHRMHSVYGLSVPLCMVTDEKFMDTIYHKPLVEMSPIFQVKYSWEQRSGSQWDQIW